LVPPHPLLLSSSVDNRYLQVGVAKVKTTESAHQIDEAGGIKVTVTNVASPVKKPMGLGGLGLKLNIGREEEEKR
jgi:hypothetical protein